MDDDDGYTIEGRFYKAKTKKEALRMHERYKKTQLPTWMTMEALGYEPDSIHAGMHALEEGKRKRGENNISTCQTVSDSMRPRLTDKGYVRAHMYPFTDAGKRKAVKKELEYREDNKQVQVHPMVCWDANPPGKYWTVWVRSFERQKRQGAGTDNTGHISAGSFYARGARRGEAQRRGAASGWYALRPEARAAVSCPKCNAPIGATCVTEQYVEIDGELVRKGKPTNSHRQRVEKYLEQQGSSLEEVSDKAYKARKTLTREEEQAYRESLPQRKAEAKERREAKRKAKRLREEGAEERTEEGFKFIDEQPPENESPKSRAIMVVTESGRILGYTWSTPRALGESARWGGKRKDPQGIERTFIIVED